MPTVHFLNVKEGDCSVVQHRSGHVSVIDVCNAKSVDVTEELRAALAKLDRGVGGNFQQKKHPVNPISYMRDRSITSVFRYVQTHPDMDHMDGIKAFFEEFEPVNFWDTDNSKEIPGSEWSGSQYSKEDWDFYKRLRDSRPEEDPKRLALLSGARGPYYNRDGDGRPGGDGLFILAPTQDLVDEANSTAGDYHRCSYVLLQRFGNHRIIFGGDSHDATWEHILDNYRSEVTDVDLLIAPHHGRKSGRSYEFLDVLNPALTFFGNARSEHLAYEAWRRRGLPIITNNQANCMIVYCGLDEMQLYVTHEHFARAVNANTSYSERFKAWYVAQVVR